MTPRSRQAYRPVPAGFLTHILGFLFGAVLVLVLAGAGGALAQEEEDGPYRLKPGDVLSVTVLEDPLLDRQVLVAPDGRISLPLAGSITVEGRTPVELAGIVRGRLRSRFVDPPTVTVSLMSVGAGGADAVERSEVYVLGEVARPGRYEYDPETPITVLQALTLAGGPSAFAATARIQVRERVDDIEKLRFFNYEAIADDAATGLDLAVLVDGAIIIVPERGLFE